MKLGEFLQIYGENKGAVALAMKKANAQLLFFGFL